MDSNWRKCILRGDSRDIIKRIPDNSIDFILTDPPYNLGQHSTGNIPLPGRSAMNNDVAEWDMIDFNPEEWADEFIRILKPTGNLFIFTSYNQLGRWYNCLDHKFDTSNFMIWHKTNPAPKIFKDDCRIDWSWEGERIVNFVRGLSPYPAAWSPMFVEGEERGSAKIFEVKFEPKQHSFEAGKIFSDGKESISVSCTDGIIHIHSMQMAGKRRMSNHDLLLGFRDIESYSFR